MKTVSFVCAALAALLFVGKSTMAATLFSDDFEAGVSSGTWTQVAIAGQSLLQGDTGGHHLGAQSAKQVNAFVDGVVDVYYMRNKPGTVSVGIVPSGQREVATVQFWDENIRTDTSQDGSTNLGGAIMLANSSGSDFYQVGVNSDVSLNNYYVRTSLGGNVATSVARTQGWHELRIEALPYTGSNDVQFYIDNALVGTGNRRPGAGAGFVLDEIRLGLSVRTPDSPFWFDNVSLAMVPEPGCFALLCCVWAGLSSSRRRQATA